ncbi:MAG: hypothetical protein Q9178_003565 [Gyalolechia marmorata]
MPHTVLQKMPCCKNPIPIVSTRNPDGSIDLAVYPNISLSVENFMITLPTDSQAMSNMLFRKDCVVNIPPHELAPAVMRLIRTSDSRESATAPLRDVRAKFAEAKLTPCRSMEITTAGVEECPIRVEAELICVHPLPDISFKAVGLRVLRINADMSIMKAGSQCEIDLEKWQPLQTGSRDLCLSTGKSLQPQDRATLNDDDRKGVVATLGRAMNGLLAKSLRKTKAPQARRAVVAASPSATSLRAVYESTEAMETDKGATIDDVPSGVNASNHPPADLLGGCKRRPHSAPCYRTTPRLAVDDP